MKGEIIKEQQSTPADLIHVWGPPTTCKLMEEAADASAEPWAAAGAGVCHLRGHLASGKSSCPTLDRSWARYER